MDLFFFSASTTHNNHVFLEWKISSEERIEQFEIERSTDGIHFEVIKLILSSCKSGQAQTFSTYDNRPADGCNYYILKKIDSLGYADYSAIQVIEMPEQEATIALQPQAI